MKKIESSSNILKQNN